MFDIPGVLRGMAYIDFFPSQIDENVSVFLVFRVSALVDTEPVECRMSCGDILESSFVYIVCRARNGGVEPISVVCSVVGPYESKSLHFNTQINLYSHTSLLRVLHNNLDPVRTTFHGQSEVIRLDLYKLNDLSITE